MHLVFLLEQVVNGLVLVSAALMFQTFVFETGNDLPYVLYLPGYALTAAYAHWLLRARRADAAEAVAERLTDRAPQRLSSWRLLEVICTETRDNACQAAARRGMEAARKDFGIDLPPGERASNPLLGQQWR